jgi:hypothetical protein
MPLNFVITHAEAEIALRLKIIKFPPPREPLQSETRLIPYTQSAIAHIQNANIIVSHIIVVLDTRNAGVKRVATAATMG